MCTYISEFMHNLYYLCVIYIKLIGMGLFGSKKSEEELMEEALEKCNIFEGLLCRVTFPDIEIRLNSRSGWVKGAATLTLGIIGLAATSGFKQEEQNRQLTTTIQVVDKGIVFKKANKDGKDLRIPYEDIESAKRNPNDQDIIIVQLVENQDIKIMFFMGNGTSMKQDFYVENHFINIINERATGAQYEEAGWGLEHGTAEPHETKQENNSLLDDLERLGNMYKEGLLTDEEFAAMKKKLIVGD